MGRIRATAAAAIVAVAVLGSLSAAPRPRVVVVGGTPGHQDLAAWAIERFATAGFSLPRLEIRFSEDRSDCEDHLGYYEDGVVRLCHRHLDEMAARGIVHEIAHGWVETTLPDDVREAFMRLRGLSTWNDPNASWDERASEQAAEIVAWAVGDQDDGTRAPSFPANSRPELEAAYRVLTGRSLPRLAPSMLWVPRS